MPFRTSNHEDRAIPSCDTWRWTPAFFDARRGRLRTEGVLKMAVTLYGFADESGDPRTDDLLCICGFLGWHESWDDFSPRWARSLQRARLKSLHATQLMSRQKRFKKWARSEIDGAVSNFIEAIRSTAPALVGMAVGIDLKHYRSLKVGQQNEIGRPLLICVAGLIKLAEKTLQQWREVQRGIAGINLTFDYSQEDSVDILETWIKLKKERRELLGSIKCVSFADDQFFYPLQAADLLANLTTRYWREGAPRTLPDDHHLKKLFPLNQNQGPFMFHDLITAERINEAVRKHKRLY